MSDDPNARFLKACRGEEVDRPPLWLMRQAGRYLPEYQEVRRQAGDFLTLCHTPEYAVEVTLQPIRRFGFDASIVFSDILVPAQSMGADVTFVAGEGPKINNPVRSADDVAALVCPEPEEASPAVFETLRVLRRELPVPLIGFVAAPFTLLCYLVEGGGSKNFEHTKALVLGNPHLAQQLVNKIVDYSAKHAIAEVKAGAQVLQLFDTWAELLTADDYARWCLPAANNVFAKVKQAMATGEIPEVPLIYFSKGGAGHIDSLPLIQADVISIDWRLRLAVAREALPDKVLQGNFDPLILYTNPETVRERAKLLLDEGGGQRHVMNLGHGILPKTPLANVEALVETVQAWRPAGS